jgi:hypothetical protein
MFKITPTTTPMAITMLSGASCLVRSMKALANTTASLRALALLRVTMLTKPTTPPSLAEA